MADPNMRSPYMSFAPAASGQQSNPTGQPFPPYTSPNVYVAASQPTPFYQPSAPLNGAPMASQPMASQMPAGVQSTPFPPQQQMYTTPQFMPPQQQFMPPQQFTSQQFMPPQQSPQFGSFPQQYSAQRTSPAPSYGKYSVEVPGSSRGGESNAHRSSQFPDRLISLPFENEPNVNTAFHVLQRSASKFPARPYLGHRAYLVDGKRGDYLWQSYADVYKDVLDYGLGLAAVCGLRSGASGESQARLGIYGINRPEWTKLMNAAFSQRLCIVPLYDTLGPDAARYIIDHAELTVVCCENSKIDSVLKANANRRVRCIVTFDNLSPEEEMKCRNAGVMALSVATLKAKGRDLRGTVPANPPLPQDWAVIMYTSGTTGDPKGVILSHRNNLASVSGLLRGTKTGLPAPGFFINQEDVYISFLPLAHIYEATIQVALAVCGASIGFFQGDVLKLLTEDIPTLRPTILAAVPRIYSRIYDKVTQGMQARGAVASWLFNKALATQTENVKAGRPRSGFWDKIIFSKLQARFGGRIRIMASAAAPLPAGLHTFLKVAFNCPVLQAYGMTENAGAATGMVWDTTTTGTVGGPYPAMEVKVQDTEDYKCTDIYPRSQAEFEGQWSFKGAFDPSMAGKRVERGEVCLRGPNVALGYFKNPKDTQDTFDSQGWLHTGDVGMWKEDGSLQIIDRKKNIFKLSQGEYVAPDSVEGAIAPCKFVGQVFVYGSSFEAVLVAVIVPDRDVVMGLPQAAGKTLAQAVAQPEVKKMILDDITATCRQNGMRGFEIPKDIHFETNVNGLGLGFTVDNDCLTPTFKPKRPQLTKRYQRELDAMYARMTK
mmetsp:Transcript_17619/g.42461  ORF Transcript_17619/g.42461 Transcript_17619/m.42461 type:complete len:828 (-) Transcript_17619:341-2824(-)|eukprot:CAMPEP_0180134528 /NCGR_PEP_ID=MMETSP0986-20121125/10219_1 /TAXON_ID=697907 /ORGANISM="non described non described, Strain CCMP2293" /LENGTH=827 /DNA_ID=CAMNT_0022074913 /DNA_START=1 /DNA_END=2484 /DNA_ORIENTATION=-